ncbi:MAG: hypothetical protein JO152_14320 [Mycobacteriaceae bacterium]|nr:hypothetical protein [Mycobacteriaceae bacterium]
MFAADDAAARDLLMSLVPCIEQTGRDDQMLEVFAQLGEIYLMRGANDTVADCVGRIRDCLAIYIAMPETGAPVGMSAAEIALMIRRYGKAMTLGLPNWPGRAWSWATTSASGGPNRPLSLTILARRAATTMRWQQAPSRAQGR